MFSGTVNIEDETQPGPALWVAIIGLSCYWLEFDPCSLGVLITKVEVGFGGVLV